MEAKANATFTPELGQIEQANEMFAPYRFLVCATPEEALEALEVRRKVYHGACEYDVSIPDYFDERSWFVLAQERSSGRSIGTMRTTPRKHGALELEQYFRLPDRLRSERAAEMSRFAIVPEYRRGKGAPIVAMGLCNIIKRLLDRTNHEYMVFAAKAKQAATYSWMRFTGTGIRARYRDLGTEEHELMFGNIARSDVILEGHPFKLIFDGYPFEAGIIPASVPPLGLGVDRPRVAARG